MANMNWYYAEAGQQLGPVNEEELLRLVEAGKIQSDTLVWHEGLPNWQAYGYLKPKATDVPPILPSAGPVPGMNEVRCVECGQIVPQENALFSGGNWVCASCKPLYLQRLKEGATLPLAPTELAYAGFWIRLGAKMIDGIAMAVVIGIPIGILLVLSFSSNRNRGGNPLSTIGLQLLANLGSFIFTLVYNWFFLSKYGATLGKMACGLLVVTPTGGKISSGQALGRAAAEILSQLICYIGYIIAAFDQEKRALHDHMANTRVVRK